MAVERVPSIHLVLQALGLAGCTIVFVAQRGRFGRDEGMYRDRGGSQMNRFGL
jgi:hypothetical protein